MDKLPKTLEIGVALTGETMQAKKAQLAFGWPPQASITSEGPEGASRTRIAIDTPRLRSSLSQHFQRSVLEPSRHDPWVRSRR